MQYETGKRYKAQIFDKIHERDLRKDNGNVLHPIILYDERSCYRLLPAMAVHFRTG